MKGIPKRAYWKQIFALAPAFFNVFLVGCSVGWTPNALLFFQQGIEVTATPYEWSFVATSNDLAQLLFAIPSGILVDRFGRKKIIITAGFCHLISWLLLSLTSSIGIIVLARFFSGIAIALVCSTTPITVGEIASPDIRAQLISIVQIFFNFGMIFQSIVSILFGSYFFLSYCSLALSCTFFITLLWILETPGYLLSVSKISEARINLECIRQGYTEEEIDFEFHGMKTYILGEKKAKHQVDWVQFLKSKSIREPLITVTSIYFFVNAMGLALISSYSTVIVPKNDIVPSKYYPIILSFVPFILTLIIPVYVEKFPRRTLFLMGVALIGLLHSLLALTSYYFLQHHVDLCRWIVIFGILSLMLISRGSVEPMTNALNSELLPQLVKGFGSSLCAMAQAGGNIILYLMYSLVATNLGQYYVFIVLAANSLVLFFLVYFRLPEARGRYLADLQSYPDETTPIKTKTNFVRIEREKI